MSAPRPYKTDPLHPPSSVRARYHGKFQYIYQTVPVIVFHMVFTLCLGKLYVCHLRMHFFPEPLITRFQRNFELILSSTYNALVRDTARHCHYKLDLYTGIATWRYRGQRANDASLRTDNYRTDSETENKHIVGLKVLLKLKWTILVAVCPKNPEPN